MAVHEDREAFIPYSRTDIVDICIEDGKLPPEETEKFREFCSILSAYYHFELHHTQERLKGDFAPFNPDADTKFRIEPTEEQLAQKQANLMKDFQTVLERANYNLLSETALQEAFKEVSLIKLRTDVDFRDFDEVICYYRGDAPQTIQLKRLFRKDVDFTFGVFERVVLLVKYQGEEYFAKRKAKRKNLKGIPGKVYIYMYKGIPKFDLELIFPNVKTSMTWKDRLFFGVPIVGAAIPIILKTLPQIIIIVGLVLFLTVGPSALENLDTDEDEVRNIMPVLLALFSLALTLGGFAFKQYTNYKNKQIKFQKNVTETLFFKNLATNASVFQSLIDSAEEEECKEIILVYYHLLTSDGPLTAEQLDNKIEAWMEEKLDAHIDFDINGPLNNLEGIKASLVANSSESNVPQESLLTYDGENCKVMPLEDAKKVIDYLWDNAFLYANESSLS